ncbi:hypothetical protein FB451DRAFT_1556325 [Mycena latifolia]|nr:hypothetical protein FB451DRAFT_1556325 [Mycena latifolia]
MAPLQPFDINGTIGALEIGVLVSFVLFGVETPQAYINYGRFPSDSLKLKILVASMWILEMGHVISIGHSIYIVSVSDYGHPERLLRAPDSMAVALLFSGFIVACGCTFLFVCAIRMTSTMGWETQWSWLLNSIWTVSSSNDIILAVALTHAL